MHISKASGTACIIAASLATDYHDPRRQALVPKLAADLAPYFLKTCGAPVYFFAPFIGGRWLRFVTRCLESLLMPGLSLHYLVRKKFIEDAAHDVLERGFVRQMVVLGAGFDTLALRLHRLYPGVQFLELDHPATQQAKQSGLIGHFPLDSNMHFLPVDFTQHSLEEVLLGSATYDPSLDTLFIAEGILVYLREAEVKKIFHFIRSHSGAQSLFVFSFMEYAPNGKLEFQKPNAFVDYWLKKGDELFLWGIQKQKLQNFLTPLGFVLKDLGDSELFRKRYLKGENATETLISGECVAITTTQTTEQ